MPALNLIPLDVVSQNDLTYQTLDGSDTFTFSSAKSQLLLVRNPTVSTINATLIGDGSPATIVCQGIGTTAVVAEALDIDADADASLFLNVIATKLKGITTITGGTGLEVAWVSL